MNVYLVRHGEAVSERVDPARPLSPDGREQVQAMAAYLSRLGGRVLPVAIEQVRHSGKLRARQTAEIFAAALAGQAELVEAGNLGPNEDPRAVAEELNAMRERGSAIMLVGHLPHLGRLVGVLVVGEPDVQPVRIGAADVLKLSWGETDGWGLDWHLSSSLVCRVP